MMYDLFQFQCGFSISMWINKSYRLNLSGLVLNPDKVIKYLFSWVNLIKKKLL